MSHDDPARPTCPVCQSRTTTLIATVKDERTLDIFLCLACRIEFTLERSTSVLEHRDVERT
jgi:transcription elongation factor Elf1